jgi:hypothetical protein
LNFTAVMCLVPILLLVLQGLYNLTPLIPVLSAKVERNPLQPIHDVDAGLFRQQVHLRRKINGGLPAYNMVFKRILKRLCRYRVNRSEGLTVTECNDHSLAILSHYSPLTGAHQHS